VQSGDTNRVQELIAQGASLDNGGPNGFTPLIAALDNRDVSMVQLLLDAGANLDKSIWWKGDEKPIHVAIRVAREEGNFELLHILLEAGADPNATHVGGEEGVRYTALSDAVGPGVRNTEIVRELIKWGANPMGSGGMHLYCPTGSLLDYAAVHGNVELVRLFIAAGHVVDPSPDQIRQGDGLSYGLSPLMFAVCGGHANVVTVLLEDYEVSVSTKNRAGCTALDYAIRHDRDDIVDILRRAGSEADGEGCAIYADGGHR
jgi:ankyrin repeat protein